MQYILTQEEVDNIRSQGVDEGFRNAQDLMSKVLNGDSKAILIKGGPEGATIWDDAFKNNPWRILLDKLNIQRSL